MQITSAMKMVSAARLKKSQEMIEKMRPYAEKMDELILDLSSNSEIKGGLTEEREEETVLFVFYSSNKGLCGSFNTSLVKYLEEFSKNSSSEVKKRSLLFRKKS